MSGLMSLPSVGVPFGQAEMFSRIKADIVQADMLAGETPVALRASFVSPAILNKESVG